MYDAEAMAEVEEGAAFIARAPKLMDVMEAVCAVYRIGKMDLMSFRRCSHFVDARDAFYWCAKTFTPRSYPEIGRFLADRDHSSVWAGVMRAKQRFDRHKTRLVLVAKRLGIEVKEVRK